MTDHTKKYHTSGSHRPAFFHSHDQSHPSSSFSTSFQDQPSSYSYFSFFSRAIKIFTEYLYELINAKKANPQPEPKKENLRPRSEPFTLPSGDPQRQVNTTLIEGMFFSKTNPPTPKLDKIARDQEKTESAQPVRLTR